MIKKLFFSTLLSVVVADAAIEEKQPEQKVHPSTLSREKPLLANLHVRFRPGYSTFLVHSTGKNRGYLTFNAVKVANYNISRKKGASEVTIGRLSHARELINVSKTELHAGVAKALRLWKKDKKSRGRYLLGWRLRRGKRPSKLSKKPGFEQKK